MEMVSAAKLSKIKTAFFTSRPYLAALEGMLFDLLADTPGLTSPLLAQRTPVQATLVIVITSDTGLCGTYNTNLLRYADSFINKLQSPDTAVMSIGSEGFKYFRKKGFVIKESYPGLYGRYSAEFADRITAGIIKKFTDSEFDEAYIAFSRFSPSLRHVPSVQKILNIEPHAQERKFFIYEPSAQVVLDSLLKRYVTYKMRSVLLEAFTAEHSARMLAMKTATDNAGELIDRLTLERNKARQFAITKEVLEIAGSAEALKG
jgi:F-type H+-transporting ATPase subunit gamma